MTAALTKNDCDLILQSLQFTKHKFDSYDYESYELKRSRMDDVTRVQEKIRTVRRTAPTIEGAPPA